ncbi:conserved unknown protein [Ectocarpus siliculosus]|uniref:Uncharacterized protein n=1 Tax=Ectocarpus siliculosus TaxID=2880 RepID=D8LIV5_ECTSI|nr:conserved unknown protein [Ectocarpus siliculosus]|eukprot:CBN76839.1 conserved unknown protein [Ectocarpus siliculosus]
MSATTTATSTLGGCGRRRVAVRLAFLSAVVLTVVVALAVVEVGVSLRWSGSSSGAGAGAGGGSLAFLADNDVGGGDGGEDAATTAVGGAESEDASPGGGGVGAKRAYAVAFPDVRDPLVLERARALRNSLGALKNDDEEIVAIVPRYSGKQLVSPLTDAGYRVLPRDTPAPPWRTSGRFVQQAMAATGAGWGSEGANDGGSGGGGGHGWNLLALEALSLTEYEEIVVLDQKMVIFQSAEHLPRRALIGSDGGGSSIPREAQVPGGQAPGREGGKGEEHWWQGRWRFLSGDGSGGGELGGSESATADKLPRLLPEGDGWTIGFAAGDKSTFASGPGVNSLSPAHRDLFFGQHAALMTVRPNAELYDEISHLLCKRRRLGQRDTEPAGDRGESSVPGAAARSFATASLERNTLDRSGSRSDDAGRVTDFDIRGDGGRRGGRDKTEEGSFAPAMADATTAVEVPGDRGREERSLAGTGRLRSSPKDGAMSRELGGARGIGRRRLGGSDGGSSGDGGEDGDSAERRGGEEGTGEKVNEDGGEEGEMEEERQKQEGEEEVKMGDSNRVGDAVRLAWIPADPCSCTDAPGAVGEACRGWLISRAAGPPSRHSRGDGEAQAPSESAGTPPGPDGLSLALSVCKDRAFESPLRLPAVPEEEAARTAAAAGASYSARRSPGEGGGADEGLLSALPPPPPPPLWQEVKPKQKAVVTQEDLNSFQHFWLANVEHKVLMVAIPKVACTQVHALFLRLQGSENWNTQRMEEIHYHKDMDKYKLSTMPNMPPERASAILNDPTWTKGVFLRDPTERLLSCFLDKVVHRRSYSVNVFKAEEVLSFEKFVDLTSKTAKARLQKDYPGGNLGLTRRSNPHWRPQLFFGLDKFLPYFDFVGDFKHVQEHSEEFLKRAGLWEKFGASGWGRWGQAAFFQSYCSSAASSMTLLQSCYLAEE